MESWRMWRGAEPASAPGARRDGPASRDFSWYWLGQTISTLGTSFTTFALPLLVFTITGSAIDLSLTTAAAILPYVFFGVVAGAWVDRVRRKRVMIVADLVRALVTTCIPLAATASLLSVWVVYAVAFVNSTCAICFDAANFAAVPSLVDADELVRANGRIQGSYSIARVVGPLVGGALLALVSLPLLLLFDAASYLVSAGSLALVRASFERADGSRFRGSLRGDVADGIRYLFGHPVLRSLVLLLFVINFLLPTASGQIVLFAKERLAASDTQIGFLYAAGGLGTVVLALLAERLGRRRTLGSVAVCALIVEGLCIAALAAANSYWAALPLWGLRGGADILFVISTYSLAQTIVPSQLLGRVITVIRVSTWSTGAVGAILGGLVIDQTHNVALVYGAVGLAVVLSALVFMFSPLARAHIAPPADATSQPAAIPAE